MARRRDRARGAYRSYRSQAAQRSGANTLRGEWRKLPGPVRTFTPIVILLTIAITYPFYLSSLPTGNVPLIYSFPSVRSAVTILVFTMMAVGLNIVVGYAACSTSATSPSTRSAPTPPAGSPRASSSR